MNKGGGGTQTVVQGEVPEYAEPYLKNILATAETVYDRPYTEYTGQRIAEEAPQRTLASEGIEQLVEVGAPYYGEAMDVTRGLIRQFQEPQQFTTEIAQEYMTPFLEENLRRQKSAALTDYQAQAARRSADAIKAGAFGGGREGVIEAQAESNLMKRLADIEATGRQSAYEQAQQQFERDRAFRSGQLGSQADLATGLAGLGERSTGAYLERLQQLEGVGKAEEARRQLQLDQAYQEFLAQQQFPEEQLERFGALIRGTPQATRTAPTNVGQQLLGLGLTGLQLAELGAFGS